MKTFASEISGVPLPNAVCDVNTIVIKRDENHLFLEFLVWANAESKAEGKPPLPEPIKVNLSGERVQELKAQFPALFRQLIGAAFTIAEAEKAFPADAKDV